MSEEQKNNECTEESCADAHMRTHAAAKRQTSVNRQTNIPT